MKKIIIYLLFLGLINIQVYAATADANLSLEYENGDSTVTVSIYIENPTKQKVISVQSWLEYDPKVLQGNKINTDDSAFNFVAPGENTFDTQKGLVKIGRSSTEGGANNDKIFVAKIHFKRLQNTPTSISFHNYQLGPNGSVSVRVFEDGFPITILKEEPKKITIAPETNVPNDELTPTEDGNQNTENNTQNTEQNNNTQNTPAETEIPESRPQNLRVTSGPGYAILAWNNLEDVKGYNIYFSQNSGRYLQRRSVGNTNEYYLEGLEIGANYYFAVTGYDINEKETDYSDEVRIRIGYPDSATSPLILSKLDNILNNTKRHVNSGPEDLMIFLLIFSSIAAIFIAKNKKYA